LEGKQLKVSFGTTKYCAYFLRGYECPNPDCFYLHEFDPLNEVTSRDSKLVFDEQNKEASSLVRGNLDELVGQMLEAGQQQSPAGFPSLASMFELLTA
jgi:hypothetical protein